MGRWGWFQTVCLSVAAVSKTELQKCPLRIEYQAATSSTVEFWFLLLSTLSLWHAVPLCNFLCCSEPFFPADFDGAGAQWYWKNQRAECPHAGPPCLQRSPTHPPLHGAYSEGNSRQTDWHLLWGVLRLFIWGDETVSVLTGMMNKLDNFFGPRDKGHIKHPQLKNPKNLTDCSRRVSL